MTMTDGTTRLNTTHTIICWQSNQYIDIVENGLQHSQAEAELTAITKAHLIPVVEPTASRTHPMAHGCYDGPFGVTGINGGNENCSNPPEDYTIVPQILGVDFEARAASMRVEAENVTDPSARSHAQRPLTKPMLCS